VVNDSSARRINSSSNLKLDCLFNGRWNTSNAGFGAGTYRVYVALTDGNGSVLLNMDGSYVNTSYNFTYSPSAGPIIQSVEITNAVAYTNDSLTCRFNITGNGAINANVTWINEDSGEILFTNNSISCTSGQFCYNTLRWNHTHHNYHILCSIAANDSNGWSLWSNSSSLVISNYSTNLSIENGTNQPVQNQQVMFYANYTSTDFPVSGVGLNKYEIGAVIWNYTNTSEEFNVIRFADLDGDGIRDEVVFGSGTAGGGTGDVYAFHGNGTFYWMSGEYDAGIDEIVVRDFDKDGFDEIVYSCKTFGRMLKSDGTTNWSSVDADMRSTLAIADLDDDNYEDIVFFGGDPAGIYVYNSTGSQMWNVTGMCGKYEAYELTIGDFDRDGREDDIAFAHWVGLSVYNGSGSFLFNVSMIGQMSIYSVKAVDLDHDNFRDELVFGEHEDLWAFEWNGTFNSTYQSGDEIWRQQNPVGSIYEIVITDLDGDCYVDDIVAANGGHGSSLGLGIMAIDNNSNLLWNYSTGSNPDDQDRIFSLAVNDIDDDGEEEIIFSSEDFDDIVVLNLTGSILWKFETDYGDVGVTTASSPGIDVNDINLDGVKDIAFVSEHGYVHTLQSVTCVASFNDSTSYNMSWNNTLRKWEVAKTFANPGNYTYNITCSKGGYETQFASSPIEVLSAAVVQEVNITNTLAYTNDSLTCRFNVTGSGSITANVTWINEDTGEVLFTNNSIPCTSDQYCYNSLRWNYTHHDYHILCSVAANDSNGWSLWSNSSSLVISNYSTNLSIENGTENPVNNQQVKFYVNYSSTDFRDLGLILFMSPQLDDGAHSIERADLNCDGHRTDIIIGERGDLYAYNINGSELWNATEPLGDINEIRVTAMQNDGCYDDIVTGESGGFTRVYNSSGAQIFATPDLGSGNIIDVGDFDGQGLKNDIATKGTTATYVYKTKDGLSFTLNWSQPTDSGNYEIITTEDLDGDGIDDVATTSNPSGWIYVFSGRNGTTIWRAYTEYDPQDSNGNLESITAMDLDHDGHMDDLAVSMCDLARWAFTWNGTYNATYNISDAIFHGTLGGSAHESNTMDVNLNGYIDNFITSSSQTLNVFDNQNNTLWSRTGNTGTIYQIELADLYDAGTKQILLAGANSILEVVNRTGSQVFSYDFNQGSIGGYPGNDPATCVGDMNRDGIDDVGVALADGYGVVLTVASCTASFNDSTSYNMSWNHSLGKWEINRTFPQPGKYSYNISCGKQGYEAGISPNNIVIIQDTKPPNITLIWPQNHTLLYGGNPINFTFNVTENSMNVVNCSLILDGSIIATDTSITLNTNQTISHSLTNGTYNWTINCTDINGLEGSGGLFNLNISNNPPDITINAPLNETLFPTQSNISLNYTLNDSENDTIWCRIYAAYEHLDGRYDLVYNGTIASNAGYIFNLSGAVSTNITGNATETQPDNSTVLLYHFNNNSAYGENDTSVYDFSGKGNNGTCTGASCPSFNVSGGKFGGAFRFDGSNDYINCGHNLSLSISEEITFEAWVSVANPEQDRDMRILSKKLHWCADSSEGNYGFEYNPLHNRLRILGSGNNLATAEGVDLDTRWHHLAGTINGTTAALYVDGVDRTTDAVVSSLNGSGTTDVDLLVGAMPYQGGSSYFFNGLIDEVVVYNRTLEAEEIFDHYRLKQGRYYWYVNASDYAQSSETGIYWFELGNASGPECGVIDQDTTLTGNITAEGTCFIINASDVILDCAGHTITGNNTGIGVLSFNKTNVSIRNCVLLNFSDGIYLNYTNNSLVYNNTAYNLQDDGLELYYANNNTIQRNNLTGHDGGNNIAIQMEQSDNNLLQNNNLITGDAGLSISYCERNNITGNNISKTHVNHRGIFNRNINSPAAANNSIDTSNKIDGQPIYYYSLGNLNPFLQCPTKVGNLSAAHLELAYCNNTLINNVSLSGGYLALDILSGVNMSNISVTNAVDGLFLYGVNSINLDGFDFSSVHDGTYYWSGSHSNMFRNGVINCSGVGLNLVQSEQNTSFINLTIYANYAIRYSYNTKTNIEVINSSLNSQTYDVSLRASGMDSGELTLVNTSFNKSKVSIESAYRNLTVQYYLRARVVDGSGSGIDAVSVNITDNESNTVVADAQTNAQGYTSWFIVTEYTQNRSQDYDAGNVSFYTPHNINVSKNGYSNSTPATMNQSRTVTLGLGVTYCSNCSDCSQKIQAAGFGDVIFLAANITNHAGANDSTHMGESCIRFGGADEVTFSCQGNTISGDGDAFGYGIWLNDSDAGSDNNTIKDCNISLFGYGIHLSYSDNNNISNHTISDNEFEGVYMLHSTNNRFQNLLLNENSHGDVLLYTASEANCNHVFENITGSGNRTIGFYNSTVNLQDKIFSELILCNADNSILDNITIRGSDTQHNNRLLIVRTDNSSISNINSTQNRGLLIIRSGNNTFTNITAVDNVDYDMRLSYSDNNTLQDVTLEDSYMGLYLYQSSYNRIIDMKSAGNSQGVYLSSDCSYNQINDSVIEQSTSYGVYFDEAASFTPENNTFYNNLFNNTVNLLNPYNTTNHYNISKTSGSSIVGGPYLGGNYWTNPSGTGWSDNCTDTSGDGICEQPYLISPNNTDYLPLSSTVYCMNCSDCSKKIRNANPGDIIYLVANITNHAGANDSTHPGESCIKFGGADYITFNCQGNTVSGDNDSFGYGIWLNQSNGGSNNNTIRDCSNISNFYQNILLWSSDNNTLTNITTHGSGSYSIHLYNSHFNKLTDITSSGDEHGIWLAISNHSIIEDVIVTPNVRAFRLDDSICNNFTNVTSDSGYDGFFFYSSSSNNTIRNSRIVDSTNYGIWLYNTSSGFPQNNLFYNNYFNNSVNVYSENDNNTNYFNTSLNCSVGANIINGSCFGGNYWTNPSGTGWSDNCTDTSGDGICEQPYLISPNNTDYHPLTLNENIAPNVTQAELYPVAPTSTDDLLLNVTCTDPDNTSLIAYWFAWNDSVQTSINGSQAVVNGSETEIDAVGFGNTSVGESWVLEVWCGDGLTNTSHQNTSTRTIANAQTILNSAELYPAAPISTDDLLLNVTCTDPDNSTLFTYWLAWNNSIQTSITGSQSIANGSETEITVVGSGNTTVGENWTLEVWCGDGTTNSSHQNTSTRTIQNTPPAITLQYPPDNSTWNTSSQVIFTYNVSDLEHTIANCSLYLNNILNKTESSVTEGINQSINASLADGTYNWSIHCLDSLGLEGASAEWSLNVNLPTLSITINTPQNTTYPMNQTLLNTIVSGGSGIYTCTYSIDNWATNHSYDCNTTTINCSEGPNTLRVRVNDSFGAEAYDSVNFTVDSQTPQVTLLSPENGSTDADSNVVFRYTVSDALASHLNCTLYHDVSGSFTDNGSQMTSSGATGSFTRNNLPDGVYVWNILCSDGLHSSFATNNRSLTIDSTAVDLYIKPVDIAFSNNNPTEGNTVHITATIHNSGTGSYSSFQVRLLIDNTTHDTNMLSVGGSASNTTTFTWIAIQGEHDITVAADPTNTVAELNESNNNASRSISVSHAPSPDEDMHISVDGECANETVTISIEDDASDPVDGVHVEVDYDGVEVFDDHTDGSGEVSFTPEATGSYDVDAERSGYNDVSDSFTINLCVSCTDGLMNQDETGVDCGGSICPPCEDGEGCLVDEDCESGWCLNGTCRTSTCVDGIMGPDELGVDCGGPCPPCESCNDSIQNQDETGVDCGGSICPPCEDGSGCVDDEDCESGYCVNGTCVTPTCFDGVMNQDETGVDCGGSCMPCHCLNGILDGDELEVDCGGSCPQCGCFNEVQDGNETDTDCGGECPPCEDGEGCLTDEDCESGYCLNGTCVTPTCFDGILNQDETSIDCGGSICPPCEDGGGCLTDEDCESGYCVNGTCRTPSCFDGILNQDETSIDCGGECPPCGDGWGCVVDEDCVSGWCLNGTCMTPTCFDGVMNQNETGVDCGGSCMPCHCFNGILDGDELEVDCGGSCPPCGCFNGVMDGNETGVDCGGECPPCGVGGGCLVDADCVSGWCHEGVCKIPSCSDGFMNQGEDDVDCGGPCLPCHCFNGVRDANESGVDCGGECPDCVIDTVVVNVTLGNLSFNQHITMNVTPFCINLRLDKGESDIDCGGPCLPCVDGKKCFVDGDCVSRWCYYGTCRTSLCDDLLLGPQEEKIDCGGPCKDCPYLKIEEGYTVGDNISLVVINPRSNLMVKVVYPNSSYEFLNVSGYGLSSYCVIPYVFNQNGVHSVDLIGYGFVGYDTHEVNVRGGEIFVLPRLPAVSEDVVNSMLIPFMVLVTVVLYLVGRRKNVVSDGWGIRDLVDSGRIRGYDKIYTTYEVAERFPDVDNLEAVELSGAELDKAEDLVDRLDVPLDEAKLLVLSNKMRAKSFFVRDDFPKESDGWVKGVRINRVGGDLKNYMKVSNEVSDKENKKKRDGE